MMKMQMMKMRMMRMLLVVLLVGGQLLVVGQPSSSSPDALYFESSGDLPIDDEDAEDFFSGSGSGDYFTLVDVVQHEARNKNFSFEGPLAPPTQNTMPSYPPTTTWASRYQPTTEKMPMSSFPGEEEERETDTEVPDSGLDAGEFGFPGTTTQPTSLTPRQTTSSIDGVPTAAETDGVPTVRGTDGVPTASSTGGVPTAAETDGVPTAAETDGVPTVRGTEGVPTASSTDGVPTASSTDGVPVASSTDGVPTVSFTDGVPIANVEERIVEDSEETLAEDVQEEGGAKEGRGGRMSDPSAAEEVTSESLWERTEVLAAVIGCGVVGFLFALFLLLLLVYRMRKKDEGSYELGDGKTPPTAYQKAPTKEFYA